MYKRLLNFTIIGSLVFMWSCFTMSCQKSNEKIDLVASTTYERVKFTFPQKGQEYKLKLNGIEVAERLNNEYYLDPLKPISVEVSSNGKILFSEESITIPNDRIIPFVYLPDGFNFLPLDQQHPILVSINPFEGMKVQIRGIGDKTAGYVINQGEQYFLNKKDVQTGSVIVEVYRDTEILYSEQIPSDALETVITLLGNPEDGLVPLDIPTDEMRAQLEEEYDTWISIMYSNKDYPEIKSLIVELAPGSFFENPRNPSEFKEGKEPIRMELKPNKPAKFALFNGFQKLDMLFIYRIYDADNPDEPLITIDQRRFVFICSGSWYNKQGEDGYKFRTYKLLPKDSQEIKDAGVRASFEPFPLYKKGFSFP